MRSKGSRFTLGVWGLSCVRQTIAQPSATVRNRPQPSATVRNRPQPSATVCNRPQPSATVRNVRVRAVWPCLWYGGFQRCKASFRVAGVALSDIATCFKTCHKSFCGRRNTFATFSDDALHVSWQGQHFEDLRCHFASQAQQFRRVVLRIFANVRAARRGNTHHSTLYTLHSTLYTLHSTMSIPLFRLYSTLYTPHFQLYTQHSALSILHSTLYTYTLHFTLYTQHLILHTLHYTLYTPHFTPCAFHFTLHTPHFTLHTLHSTLCTPHFTLDTLHFTPHPLHSTLYT